MKIFFATVLTTFLLIFSSSCQESPKSGQPQKVSERSSKLILIDTTLIDPFFIKYPDLKMYRPTVKALYQTEPKYIWYDGKGLTEFASVLLNEVNGLALEGISGPVPYQEQFRLIFEKNAANPDPESELLISSIYCFYLKNVYEGLDVGQVRETKWFLPDDGMSYSAWLDSLSTETRVTKRPMLFSQYYKLRKGLKKYLEIQEKGGWGNITMEPGLKKLKPGDSSATIPMVRTRLYLEGYLPKNNASAVFDDQLLRAVSAYQNRHNRPADSLITTPLINELNIPVSSRIKTISVNMERCRWIDPDMDRYKELIAVNIPSFRLHYIHEGKPVLVSRVVVGKEIHKTVVFSGEMSYIVFSPYWNVPNSILENEIRPAIARNPRYLEQQRMEWHDGRVRQKPGKGNALGLVKFIFPNSNNIYLHDTPSKSLFRQDERAFSHGCIRVEMARDLAILIMEKEMEWPSDKVDGLMQKGTETTYKLKQKIPVYIAYFTAWADEDGNVAFYKDIYDRDTRLASLLHQ